MCVIKRCLLFAVGIYVFAINTELCAERKGEKKIWVSLVLRDTDFNIPNFT